MVEQRTLNPLMRVRFLLEAPNNNRFRIYSGPVVIFSPSQMERTLSAELWFANEVSETAMTFGQLFDSFWRHQIKHPFFLERGVLFFKTLISSPNLCNKR